MAKGDQEELNQANVVSYFKSLTLEKKYGTTGAIEMEQGAVYIGEINKFLAPSGAQGVSISVCLSVCPFGDILPRALNSSYSLSGLSQVSYLTS